MATGGPSTTAPPTAASDSGSGGSTSSGASSGKKFDTDSWATIPNALTATRLAAVPGLCVAWCVDATGTVAVLFGAAAATDFFDGYLARKLKQRSSLGALLDPLVDKVLVAAALLVLVEHAGHPAVTIPSVAILSRELVVSTLREWVVAHRPGKPGGLPVAWHGKVKTTLQLLSLQAMLIGIALGCGDGRIGKSSSSSAKDSSQGSGSGDMVYNVGLVALWAASALTVLSGAQYVRVALAP